MVHRIRQHIKLANLADLGIRWRLPASSSIWRVSSTACSMLLRREIKRASQGRVAGSGSVDEHRISDDEWVREIHGFPLGLFRISISANGLRIYSERH